jgi:hypothetical protein
MVLSVHWICERVAALVRNPPFCRVSTARRVSAYAGREQPDAVRCGGKCDPDHIFVPRTALTSAFQPVNSVHGRFVTWRYAERWVNHLCGCLQRQPKRR